MLCAHRQPGEQPGALGPVHADHGRARRHRAHRGAAGRHAHRPGQARAARRRDRGAEDPRRPRGGPRPGRPPRQRRTAGRLADLADAGRAGQGHHPPGRPARGHRARARHRRRHPGHLARRAARSSPRTAAPSSSGWSRTATRSSPGQPLVRLHPEGTRRCTDGRCTTPPAAPTYARILGVGGYRPARVVTNDEICERIDSSDEWIRERSGIESPALGRRPTRRVVDMCVAAAGKAIAQAGIDARSRSAR